MDERFPRLILPLYSDISCEVVDLEDIANAFPYVSCDVIGAYTSFNLGGFLVSISGGGYIF